MGQSGLNTVPGLGGHHFAVSSEFLAPTAKGFHKGPQVGQQKLQSQMDSHVSTVFCKALGQRGEEPC